MNSRGPHRYSHLASVMLLLMAGMSTPLAAQENPFNQPWRLTYQERVGEKNQFTQRVEYYDTQNECARLKQWMESINIQARALKNPEFYAAITIERVGTVARDGLLESISDATDAVLRAKAMLEKKDTVLLGDTIKDYANTIKAVYANVKAFKARLLAETGTISRRAFAQVNNQILEYNQQATEYNAMIRSPDLYARLEAADNANRPKGKAPVKNFYSFDPASTIDPVKESDLRGRLESDIGLAQGKGSGSLVGREGTGTFGTSRIKTLFHDGTVVFGEGASANHGTFRQHGDRIVMSTNGYDYHGTIVGDRIRGMRTPKNAGGVSEPWQIELGEAGNGAGNKAEGLVGKTWEISSADNYRDIIWDEKPLTAVFHADGTGTKFVPADHRSPARQFSFTWTREGNTIMVRERDIGFLFKGTLNGNQIDGMCYYKNDKPWRQIWRAK